MQGLLSVPLSGFWTHSHWAPRGHKPAQPDPCDKHLPPFLSPVTSDTRSRAGLGPRNKGWAAGKQQPEVQRFHITLVYDLFYLTTHQRENKMTSTLGLREGPEQEFPKNAYYSLYRIFVTHMQRPKFSGYKMASFRWWATTINVCVFFFFKTSQDPRFCRQTHGLSSPSVWPSTRYRLWRKGYVILVQRWEGEKEEPGEKGNCTPNIISKWIIGSLGKKCLGKEKQRKG